MKGHFETLKTVLVEHPPDYGDGNTGTMLKMLYNHYNEFHRIDMAEIREKFEELYLQMNDMPLREMDGILGTVCALCRGYEKVAFMEGAKIGIRLESGLAEK